MSIKIPNGYKAIKYSTGEVIGCVSKKPGGIFGHYSGNVLRNDDSFEHVCSGGNQHRISLMITDAWERKNLPHKPWHVRFKNGSTCSVMAANEEQALDYARCFLLRRIKDELTPISAYTDDEPLPKQAFPKIDFGNLTEIKQ